ncbi:MarR family winged helix-turn-helix transcriptional regulator [Phytohabitans kaempferiae]|uniref:MarR family winged helix-turn-helix transcriptional regulator n=1 Tax=Phytohabitans kaempferiae TaxID=1620943 RepID=A0ABV6M089_9ACTN
MSTERERATADLFRVMPRHVQETVRFYDAVADQLGIHVTDLHCVGALSDAGALSAGDLAARLGLTTGAITRMIDRLVDRGFAQRVADPADRRRVLVELTPEATVEVGTHFAGMAIHLEQAIAGYSDERLRFLVNFLEESVAFTRTETERLRREGRSHSTRVSRKADG